MWINIPLDAAEVVLFLSYNGELPYVTTLVTTHIVMHVIHAVMADSTPPIRRNRPIAMTKELGPLQGITLYFLA